MGRSRVDDYSVSHALGMDLCGEICRGGHLDFTSTDAPIASRLENETTSHITTYMLLLFYRMTLSLPRRRTRRKRRRRKRTRRRKMIRKTRKTKKRTRKIRRKTRRTKRIKRTRRAQQPQLRSYFVCSSPHLKSRKTANNTRRQPRPHSHLTKPRPLSR